MADRTEGSRHLARVELLGTSFTIRSGSDPEHLNRVIETVASRIDDVSKNMRNPDGLRVALIVALNLADDLLLAHPPVHLQDVDEEGTGSADIESIASRLIDQLDQGLAGDNAQDVADGPPDSGLSSGTSAGFDSSASDR